MEITLNVFYPAVMCLGMWSKDGEIDAEINSGNGFLYLNFVRWKIVKKVLCRYMFF